MTLTANQYFQIAQGYAKAAEDPFVPPENRAVFANKAKWFGFLGRREKATLRSDGTAVNAYRDFESSPRNVGLTLWRTGAALCLIGAVLFTIAHNFFGERNYREVASQLTPPPMPSSKVTSVQPAQLNEIERQAAPKVLSSSGRQKELGSPSPPPAPTKRQAATRPTELLKVTANAKIREGPSTSTKKIGTAHHGTILEVMVREGDWVQFVDRDSGSTGWIHSSLAKLSSGSGTTSLAAPPADAMVFAPPRPLSKKRTKQKSSAPIQASTQPLSRPGSPTAGYRAYADLPDDEALLPSRKPGPGLLTKRRMLRKGGVSPGFVPPQP